LEDDFENDINNGQRNNKQKHVIDIEFHFNDGRRAGIGKGRMRSRSQRGPGGPNIGGGGPNVGEGGRGNGGGGGRFPRNRQNDNVSLSSFICFQSQDSCKTKIR
jgi:hypothetical protein